MKRIRKVVVHITGKAKSIDISPIITGARPVSVLSGPDGTFEQALAFAKANNTRLFTRSEAQYLFEHDEAFRNSVRDTYFWVLESASVFSHVCNYAWLFSGLYGFVDTTPRSSTNRVRCVGGE